MAVYQMHLLLLSPHDELDERTTMESIQDLLLEGFQWSNDNVDVEFDTINTENNDQRHYCISITCDGVWRTQIHFAEDPQVLREAQDWPLMHAIDLPIHAQIALGANFKRLKITSDPDDQGNYSDFFTALLMHLQGNFTPCYLFDAIQNELVL